MKLNELLNCDLNIEIKGIKTDSRLVENGDLFVCIKGLTNDGHNFINSAIKNGAVAILAERKIKCEVPLVVERDIQNRLPDILTKFYGNLSERLKFIGVTGTDGKTSTALIIYEFLKDIYEAAYIGTNGILSNKYFVDGATNTTPTICELYNTLDILEKNKVKFVSMETSSAGLKENRTGNILFDFGVFLNLSVYHLSYHGTFNDYKNSKIKLFKKIKKDGVAILNCDDKYYDEFLSNCSCKVLKYGKKEDADLRILKIKEGLKKTDFSISYLNTIYNIETSLIGGFNVYNICAALSVALNCGIPIEKCINKCKQLKVLGRMENIDYGQPFTLIFDFGHTINSVKTVLQYVNRFKKNRIILVSGSLPNHESDRIEKGKIMSELSDYCIFTSDTKGDETEQEIIKELTSKAKKGKYEICIDRKLAIEKAISIASDNDIVLISGVEYFFGKDRRNGVNPYLVSKEKITEKYSLTKIKTVI